jgi:hypothetical protein
MSPNKNVPLNVSNFGEDRLDGLKLLAASQDKSVAQVVRDWGDKVMNIKGIPDTRRFCEGCQKKVFTKGSINDIQLCVNCGQTTKPF